MLWIKKGRVPLVKINSWSDLSSAVLQEQSIYLKNRSNPKLFRLVNPESVILVKYKDPATMAKAKDLIQYNRLYRVVHNKVKDEI